MSGLHSRWWRWNKANVIKKKDWTICSNSFPLAGSLIYSGPLIRPRIDNVIIILNGCNIHQNDNVYCLSFKFCQSRSKKPDYCQGRCSSELPSKLISTLIRCLMISCRHLRWEGIKRTSSLFPRSSLSPSWGSLRFFCSSWISIF